MLKTRVITAVLLLAVIIPVLLYGAPWSVNALCTLFFAAACWEGCRLFWDRHAVSITALLTVFYIALLLLDPKSMILLPLLGCPVLFAGLAWCAVFVPALKWGLPKRFGWLNTILGAFYLVIIFACFGLIADWRVSVFDTMDTAFEWTFLGSVMVIVWCADIGAYFFGKAFGRHLLAPAISPGKTWEGAMGGWLCVLLVGVVCAQFFDSVETIFTLLKEAWGWLGLLLGLSFLTVVSVTGDLIESQLKRRAEIKDSSNLLPGHGGVLDRIDALIFVIPMAMLLALSALMVV